MFSSRGIKFYYLKFLRKVRNLMLNEKSREFLIFLFFFMISTGFWLLQTLKNDFEAELSVPVKLKNVPNNVVITLDPVADVKVTVKDKGTVLLNYMLGKNFFPITLDFAEYKNRGNHVTIYRNEFEKRILNQLSASTKLINVKPDTLDYIYSFGKSKRVPVKLQGNIIAGRQYYVSDTLYSPSYVLVYAPSAILDTITAAYTRKINLKDITDTIRLHTSISTVKGAKFVPNTVDVTFPVDVMTEKTVFVPLKGVNFPPDKMLRTFPSNLKIIFQVGLTRFKSITADDFILNVSYEELLKNGSDKYRIKIKSLPAGVTHVRIVPDQVDFLIEQVAAYGY